MPEHNPYAPPVAEVADITTTEAAPALWNPGAASSWSLLFSPIFGAYLHMRNWQALGQPEKAAQSKNWVIGLVAVFTVVVLAPLIIKGVAILDVLGRFGGFAMLITWYYSIGKSQQTYVFGRFGKAYPRRGWGVPLLAALGLFAAFIAVVVVLALILRKS